MPEPRRADADVMLRVKGLNVYYGRSHALQGVDLTLGHGVLSVVGRNGMGKTTLCKAIMGLTRASSGSIRLRGEEMLGLRRRKSRAMASDMCRGPQALALAHRRRTLAHDRGGEVRRLDGRARLQCVPAPRRTEEQQRRLSSPAASSRCWRSPAR